jgi:hypothetical protein
MTAGSIVVFPVSYGRGSMMKEGIVTSIDQALDYAGRPEVEITKVTYDSNTGERTVSETRPVYKIAVQTIKYDNAHDYGKRRWWETNNFTERPSYPHPDRITVVTERSQPLGTTD